MAAALGIGDDDLLLAGNAMRCGEDYILRDDRSGAGTVAVALTRQHHDDMRGKAGIGLGLVSTERIGG